MKKTIIFILTGTIFIFSSDTEIKKPNYTGDYIKDKSSAEHWEYIKKYPHMANGIYNFNSSSVELSIKDNNKTISNTKQIKPKYSIDFDRNTSCLVRNLKLYKDPTWVAKIKPRNGKIVYFSSPKSMFEFYHRPGKWFDVGVKSERDFSEILVTDFNSLKAINAEKAYFVYGSRATSPAGDDLVPFASEDEAKKFLDKYSGKRIMKFDKISDALIRLLNGRI